ncbi:MAG TPA: hypothetical protein G4O15_11030 [Dehalococcoidia bacterium]|nr:hypothetical protein [Dehalococcoidia bacterium]
MKKLLISVTLAVALILGIFGGVAAANPPDDSPRGIWDEIMSGISQIIDDIGDIFDQISEHDSKVTDSLDDITGNISDLTVAIDAVDTVLDTVQNDISDISSILGAMEISSQVYTDSGNVSTQTGDTTDEHIWNPEWSGPRHVSISIFTNCTAWHGDDYVLVSADVKGNDCYVTVARLEQADLLGQGIITVNFNAYSRWKIYVKDDDDPTSEANIVRADYNVVETFTYHDE